MHPELTPGQKRAVSSQDTASTTVSIRESPAQCRRTQDGHNHIK